MSKIYIGQYYGTSFASTLIKWRTLSKVSHTSAFLVDENGCRTDMVIEAWKGKVKKNFYAKDHLPKTEIAIYSIDCSPSQVEGFYKFLEEKIGCKYDWLAILGFVAAMNWQDKKKWFCSELIYRALEFVSLYLLQNIKYWQVTPGKLDLSPILNFETLLIT